MERLEARLRVERLEDRSTPVVSAFDLAPAIGAGVGFDGVVEFGDGSSSTGCSGVLVGDGRYILTAAHCVDQNGDKVPDVADYTVRFDLASGPTYLSVPREKVTIHPGWRGNSLISRGSDLAVMELPVLAPRGVQNAFPLYSRPDELGQSLVFYGFGAIGTGTTGEALIVEGNPNQSDSAEIQRFRVGGTGGASFTIEFAGSATSPISLNATADQIQTAINSAGFPGVAAVRVFRVNSPGNPNNGAFEIVFTDVDATQFGNSVNVPEIVIAPASGTVTSEVSTVIDGGITGVRRMGSNVVSTTQPGGIFSATFLSDSGNAVLGGGDSGGPAFLDGQVAGIASYGDDPAVLGATTSWARVSTFVTSFLNPILTAREPLILDLAFQPDGGDGDPDAIRVFQRNFRLVVEVNGVPYFDAPLGQVGSVTVRGSSDATTLQIDGVFQISIVGEGVSITRSASREVAVGAGPGGGPRVQVVDPVAGNTVRSFFAFEESFTGGVNVATGDVTGDGVPDTIVTPRFGGGPVVKVFDGVTGAEVRSFFAFDEGFRGGVSVAVGDVTGDGILDIVVAAGPGGSAHVKAFDGLTGSVVRSFFAYDASFRGGAVVAVADVDGDGIADIVTAPGAGGGPHVQVFDGRTGAVIRSFFAFDPNFTGGVSVAAGDTDGDGRAEIFASAGTGGGPAVKQFDPDGGETASEFAFESDFLGGVAVTFADDPLQEGNFRLLVSPVIPAKQIRSFGFDPAGRLLAIGEEILGSEWV